MTRIKLYLYTAPSNYDGVHKKPASKKIEVAFYI